MAYINIVNEIVIMRVSVIVTIRAIAMAHGQAFFDVLGLRVSQN